MENQYLIVTGLLAASFAGSVAVSGPLPAPLAVTGSPAIAQSATIAGPSAHFDVAHGFPRTGTERSRPSEPAQTADSVHGTRVAAARSVTSGAGARRSGSTEPRYACGTRRLTQAQMARQFGLALDTVREIPTRAGVPYEELCGLAPERREAVLERAEALARPDHSADHPDEAIRFRRLSLVDEHGEIADGAEMRAFDQAQAMRRARAAADARTRIAPRSAGLTNTSWTWLGPGNVGGRLRAGIINPGNPSEMLVGSVTGGIWRTTNGGESWTPVADFMANLAVSSLAFTPGNWSVQYAATGHRFEVRGAGVFRSDDGGVSWSQLASTNTADFSYTNRVAVAGSTVLAATNTGIFRSTDGGGTFVRVRSGQALDLKFDPSDPAHVIAGVNEFPAGTAAYSTDGGATWTDAAGLPSGTSWRVEVAYAPSNPAIVYAATTYNGAMYRSMDGGRTYTRRSAPDTVLPAGPICVALWVDPTNPDVIILGGVELYRSTDGGVTLSPMWQLYKWPHDPHADHHLILSDPGFNGSTNRTVYDLNDGGIYRIDDRSTSLGTIGYTALNNHLGVTQFYKGAANAAGTVAGGTQDNGTVCIDAGETSEQWRPENGGDGGWTAIDPNDSNFIYSEYQNGYVSRKATGCRGATFPEPLIFGLPGEFLAPMILDPNNPNTLLVGGLDLLRSTNVKAAEPTFTTIKKGPFSISTIVVAQGNSDLMLVGYGSGDVFRTTDGTAANPTWTNVRGSLPNRMVLALAIDRNNTNVYYATFGGYLSNNIYRSADAGATWTNIHGNLPSLPVRAVAIHPTSSNWLYVGTELGVFTSENGGASWQATNAGPANVSVDDLFFVGANTIYAFTYGRGVYRATVGAPGMGTLTGHVRNAMSRAPIAGATVTLSDGSSTTTDINGLYTMQVPPGTDTATASAPSFSSESASVVVTNGGNTTHDFSLIIRLEAAARR